MGTVGAVVLGVVSSVLASVVWIIALSQIRPKLVISAEIADDPSAEPSRPVYRIKVVNRSRRAAMDLRFQLDLMTPVRVKGGTVNRRTELRCRNAPLLFPRYDRSNTEDNNAYRLRVDSDIRALLAANPQSSIRLQIFARHEVSGMGKVFERHYHDPSSEIVVGTFVRGQELTLVPEERVTAVS